MSAYTKYYNSKLTEKQLYTQNGPTVSEFDDSSFRRYRDRPMIGAQNLKSVT